ncbi:kinetochore protein NDC80 homolog [Clupea harengus]|uniref:Kinetochore protein NDC80 n=1 Tax=Clupea harengus TaxID=7950 RepID=A0A6P8G0S2_CLUHA|nr:kinetochore protein NDC80 homolog [Clupea harengus]XP_031429238.1 kinetochore protein NDC80 homolog [Clupea harengus]XP_031429239.1 kinetochore protein NDC80 homolog [Clupea harengus]XP_031429240.1 kinetochore protein NDC80 homolog [Clupea harengus]XP_031429242.1 kinetochore protein NDC80 homolog [Clupea harengus]XP_031429243.1 kinetochore protein NDC80 homolog [Clupea harengus]
MSRRSRYSDAPQRVAGNRMSMVGATPQSKDLFGKLSLSKAQSVTSERRTSFFGGGNGTTGNQRNSFFGAYGGSEKIKDPRPLHDKAYIQQCIKQLCEFLSDNAFPGSITVKSLQSPSTKEFLKIFEFLMSLLDPTFQLPSVKVEEEVPRILRDLGYPFALSKSSMYSVGAPHTWPQVLGSLVWLMDSVRLFSGMKDQDLLFSDFSDGSNVVEEGAEYNKLFLEYTCETYNKFMQGADTFEEEDADYLHSLKKLYNVDEEYLESQCQRYQALAEEVERLEKESHKDPLMNKRTQKLNMQTDLQKLCGYRDNLEAFKTNQDHKAATLAEELEAITLQRDSLKQEQSRLQNILENQKFTPADIERINRERNELQQTLDSLSRSLEETQQQLWAEELAQAKAKEGAEKELAEYHKLARKLKLIPHSAANACGHDFEIKSLCEYGTAAMTEYKAQIQNPLRNMITDVEEEFNKLSNKKLSLVESLEQVNSNIVDKTNDVKQLKEQIRRLDEQLEHDLQDMAGEEERWAAEVDSAENHKKLLEKKVMDGHDEATEQLKAAQQQYHLVLQETKEERRTTVNNLTTVLSAAINHMTIIEKSISDQAKRLDRVHKETLQQDEADLKQMKAMVANFIAKANSCFDNARQSTSETDGGQLHS